MPIDRARTWRTELILTLLALLALGYIVFEAADATYGIREKLRDRRRRRVATKKTQEKR